MAWLIISTENRATSDFGKVSVSVDYGVNKRDAAALDPRNTPGVKSALTLNNLGHFEEDSVRVRSTLQHPFPVQGWSNFISTEVECRRFRLASLGQLVRDLGHGRNIGGIQLVELSKIVEQGIQIAQYACLLAARQREIREFGHALDVLLGNAHYADLEKSTAQEFARLETQQKTVS